MKNVTQRYCERTPLYCPLLLIAERTQSHGLFKQESEWVHREVTRGEVNRWLDLTDTFHANAVFELLLEWLLNLFLV